MICRSFILSVTLLAAVACPTFGQTWTGAANDGGNWNDAANWTPATVPNSATADAVFGDTGAGNIVLLGSVLTRSLTFTNDTGSYGISSTSAIISGNLTAITVGPAVTGTATINLANIFNGSLLFGTLGVATNLTITNNSTSSGASLVIGPNTVIGTPYSGGVIVAGTGNTQISGSFAAQTGFNQVVGGLTMAGPGTLTLSGNGTTLTGGLTLSGGTLTLDFSSNTAAKIGAGGFSSNGGTINLAPNASTAATQNFATTSFNAGDTELTASSGAAATFGLGAINRVAGATFSLTSGSPIITTTTGNTFGLWGNGPAFASTPTNWLTNNGSGNLVPLAAGPTNMFSSGTNTDVSGTVSPPAFTTNSLRFNLQNTTLNLSGTNTIQSGGILVTSNTGYATINGGTLASGVNELLLHCYGNLTINSNIVSSGGLTVTGASGSTGTSGLTLGGYNSLTGPINIDSGFLSLTNPYAISNASAINFNDNQPTSQQLSFGFGATAAQTIPQPIRLAASQGLTAFVANEISNFSPNTQVTLSGVISSVPGSVTPILFMGSLEGPSGINLTAANTFTGSMEILGVTLGITSDASLGNQSNSVTDNGSLEFLNGGITVARYLVAGTIICNGGDVNTISGPVNGSSPLFKDGTGTLVLSGTNTQPGVTINAGTISVAADTNLGAANSAISINSGGTLAVTGTFANSRPIAIGPLSGNVVGTSTIDVATGQTLTLNGVVSGSYGALLKTSPGTLVLGSTANTYGRGTTVQAGNLQVAADGSLGVAGTPVTIGVAGSLTFTASTSTTRTFMNSGTLTSASGATVTLNGASFYGGFMHGPGVFAVTGGAILNGITTFSSTTINQTGAASYTNFTNGGPLTLSGGSASVATFSQFTNQGSAAITVGAASEAGVSDLQSYGLLSINPATGSAMTQLTNTGATPLFFNGGSRTFIGSPATAGTFVAGIDLHGQNAEVAGGLFVNNGYVIDSTNTGAVVVADYGALVKGAGFYQYSPVTQNGGRVQAGNSPGSASFGQLTFGPGGVSNYVFAIDDATGAAGPSPNAAGQVSGWGLMKSVQRQIGAATTSGDLAWTADATNRLTFAIETLVNPTTVGTDVTGPMADFDPSRSYSWPAVTWSGVYSGPADVAALDADTIFDTSGFVNPIEGTFGWSFDPAGQTLRLTYTPSAVPEPGTLAFVGLAAVGWITFRRRQAGVGRGKSRARLETACDGVIR